jgi:dimeric dUTPase (all-alpha-NTP-PPase superfamily)
MNFVTEILNKLYETYETCDIEILHSKGIKRFHTSNWRADMRESKVSELQMEILSFKYLPEEKLNIFIRLKSNSIKFWIKSGKKITEHRLDEYDMSFSSYYNQLIEIVENIIQEPVEEFTDKNIKFIEPPKFKPDRLSRQEYE